MIILKSICLVICVILLAVCYRAKAFAARILKKSDDEITERLVIKIKLAALIMAVILFILTVAFIK